MTLTTAVAVSAVALGYSQLAGLLVATPPEPVAPVVAGEGEAVLPPPPEKKLVAERHLAHLPWAAEASHFARTDRVLLYANRWDLAEDGKSVTSTPLAVVFRDPPDRRKATDGPREPLVLAARSAKLGFVGTLDPEAGGDSRIGEATFRGPVRLDGEGGLTVSIDGDVRYDEAAGKLWSDAPVTVTQGPHVGRGLGCELKLFRVGEPHQFETIAASGVRTARLLRNVRFEVVPPEGEEGTPGVPVTIASGGSFTFDVEAARGVFVDQVVVSRSDGEAAPETLRCDRLELELAPEDAAAAAARRERVARTLPGEFVTEPLDPDLAPRRLVASGQSVVLASPARGLTVFATGATYDLQAGLIRLTHERRVRLVRDWTVVACPELTIAIDEAGTPGEIVGEGAGELRQFAADSDAVRLVTRWSERVVRPVPAVTGREEICLFGRPRVDGVGADGSAGPTLEADGLTIFLEADGKGSGADPLGGGSMKPRRMRATGSVRLRSERFAADTEELTVDLVEEADKSPSGHAQGRAVSRAHVPESPRRKPTGLSRAASASSRFTPDHPIARPTGHGHAGELGRPGGPDRVRVAQRQEASPSTPIRRQGSARASGPNDEASRAFGTRTRSRPPSGVSVGSRNRLVRLGLVHEARPVGLRLGLSENSRPFALPLGLHYPPAFASVPTALATHAVARIAPRSADSEDGPILAKADAIFVTAAGDFADLGADDDAKRPKAGGRDTPLDALREIRAVGRVRIRQDHVDGRPPLDVAGDEVRLVGSGGTRQTVHVAGAPAHLRDGGYHVQADRLHLDRDANRVWVDGPGLIEVPIDPATTGPGIRHDGRMDVWWEGAMEFDGRVAAFREQVRTVFGDNRLATPSLRVVLDGAIDFGGATEEGFGSDAKPQLEGVVCEGGVRIDGFLAETPPDETSPDSDGTGGGHYHAEFASLVYVHATGKTLAEGPGTLELWQRGEADAAGLAAAAVVAANAPADRASEAWRYTRVRFVGQVRGLVAAETATFDRDVRVVTGPVADGDDRLDADALPVDAAWMRCRELTLSRHERPSRPGSRARPEIVPAAAADLLASGGDGSAFLTLEADGNVEIDGRARGPGGTPEAFFIRGDVVTFDQSKGLYTIRGLEDREALIARDGVGGEVHAKTIWFVPATRKVVLDRISGFSGGR